MFIFSLTADNGIDLFRVRRLGGLGFIQQGVQVAVISRRGWVQLAAGDFETATYGKINLRLGPVADTAGQQD